MRKKCSTIGGALSSAAPLAHRVHSDALGGRAGPRRERERPLPWQPRARRACRSPFLEAAEVRLRPVNQPHVAANLRRSGGQRTAETPGLLLPMPSPHSWLRLLRRHARTAAHLR